MQITGTDYIPTIPNKNDVEREIQQILQIENATERAIEYMLYGMRSQLFWDGNKRTSTICANKNISVSSILQKGVSENNTADITVITELCKEADIQNAIKELKDCTVNSLIRVM